MAEGYFTNQRLKFINDTANELYPNVELLDPNWVNLLPLQKKLGQLEHEVYNQKRRIDFTAEDSVKWKNGAEDTLHDMKALEEDSIRKINLVNQIVSEVQSLAVNIEVGTSAKLDSALNEADEILEKIKNVSFIPARDKALDQKDQANILFSEIETYNYPVNNLTFDTLDLSNRISNASAKMDDLLNRTQEAQKKASAVDKLNHENRIAAQTGNLDVVRNYTAEAKEDLEAGEKLNRDASQFLNDARDNINILGECQSFDRDILIIVNNNRTNDFSLLETNAVSKTASQLNSTIVDNDNELKNLVELVPKAQEHAEFLYNRSIELDSLLTDTRNTDAVRAVSAYRDIETAIQAARNDTDAALIAIDNASSLVSGL